MRGIVCLLLLLSVATAATGATITVRRDGTGDYTTIQPAFDAAADGDTVLIGPGEYTETTTIHPAGWTGDLEVYGEIRQQRLTIIGAGADATIIGPPTYAPDYTAQSPEGLACDGPKESMVVSDLTVRNCYLGMSFNSSLQLDRCQVSNNYYGLLWTAIGLGGTVRDCRFANVDPPNPIGLGVRGVGGVVIEDCEFSRAELLIDNAGSEVSRCSILGPDVIGLYSASGVCTVSNCTISDVEIGLTTGYIGSRCEVRDSDVSGSTYAVRVDQRTTALIENSTLRGGSDSVVRMRDADTLTITGCDFVRGSGPVARCSRQAALGAVSYDLANNYWGTADEAQIQEWIIDSVDDPSIYATVLYSPFAGQSVPTESTSWGDLKALFR